MKIKLEEALDQVEGTYSEIVKVANDMLSSLFDPVNELIQELGTRINEYSAEEVRGYIIRLQLVSYQISEAKDKSSLKSALAESLREEAFAKSFNAADGTAAVKNNIALIESSQEVIVEALYNLVADLLKTKLDEVHRLIDALKSVLMSKMQELKLTMNAME